MQDLRERVAVACAKSGAKVAQVALRFAVSLSFTSKLLRRQRTSGTMVELPRHPGPAPCLDAASDQRLMACLVAQPDATLAELSAPPTRSGWVTIGLYGGVAGHGVARVEGQKKAYAPLSAKPRAL